MNHSPKIIGFGDSLMAGYGLAVEKSFPAQLEAKLRQQGIAVTIENQGVSGDTTQGGLARVTWALNSKPDLIILELGANDALRGIDPNVTKQNLDKMLAQMTAYRRPDGSPIVIILAGMKAPRNLGAAYVRKFDAIYPNLAKKYRVTLYPFFLDGVALHPDLVQADGCTPMKKAFRLWWNALFQPSKKPWHSSLSNL